MSFGIPRSTRCVFLIHRDVRYAQHGRRFHSTLHGVRPCISSMAHSSSGNRTCIHQTIHYRNLSTNAEAIKSCRVLVSNCQDIFHNLALEDWLYAHQTYEDGNTLLLWRNEPCVVIGRHQNAWAECNVAELQRRGIPVARRRSGGGAVYHDSGNLNCTFFTPKKLYDRKQNLTMIVDALQKSWNIKATVTKRDDIVLKDAYKISGSAAKLGGKVAYHHCTILCHVDTEDLHALLRSPLVSHLKSNATESVSSMIRNLCEEKANITTAQVQDAIATEYLNSTKGTLRYVNAMNELEFPGITALREELASWQWVYGHSPKFTLTRTFTRPIINDVNIAVQLNVVKGRIEEANISTSDADDITYVDLFTTLSNCLKGVRFYEDDLVMCLQDVYSEHYEMLTFVQSCLCALLDNSLQAGNGARASLIINE